jgi:hypothetical protein
MVQRAIFFAVAACGLLAEGQARGVTPESPEVRRVIGKAINFLQNANDNRLGGQCLLGLCHVKNGSDASHPKVRDALAACEAFARAPGEGTDNYSVGLAIIFLSELDPTRHRATTEKIFQHMLSRQQPGGGWGYAGGNIGDTSQTQYAALGLWMANAIGLRVPQESVERLCGWLMRTQDPSGAWGYQGQDPGNMTRVNQSEIRHSLAAAGLGSLLICADLLEITDPQETKPESELPPALRVIEGKTKKPKGVGISKVIDANAVRRAIADGNGWFAKNFAVRSERWTYYYLYGLERYQSFRELAEGRIEREPQWYNAVFVELSRAQQPDGSWGAEDESPPINTSFAVLCLLRSSGKSIQKVKATRLGDGVLLGGMGLPTETADLQERNGKIVETPLAGSVEEILAIIEDPNNPQLSRLAQSGGSLTLDSDVTKRSGQVTRLRALVSAGAFQSRLVAVKTLSKVRDLDNVPVLLYALTDPDVRIVREADKGLRFISRKFAGVGLPDEPSPVEIKAAQQAWKKWFVAIRPDAELLD